MKLVEYLGKISLQIYDLKLELQELRSLIKPAEPKKLPTLNFNKLRKLAVEEAFKQVKTTAEVAKLTGVSERTIARIMSGAE